MERPHLRDCDWLEWIKGQRVDDTAFRAAHERARQAGEPMPIWLDFKVPTWSRDPPLPLGRVVFGQDWKPPPNLCPVCRRPTYRGGDYRAAAGPPRWNKQWHACCATAYGIWRTPSWLAAWLARRQGGRCALTGEPVLGDPYPDGHRTLLPGVEVDHVVPLWRVRYEAARHPWPDVLRFWGVRNLQVLSETGHRRKTAQEAAERARMREASPDQAGLAL